MDTEDSYGSDATDDYDEGRRCFVAPPEAPVYTPTKEEFSDPLLYIHKIRPEAEKSGICKIRPPSDWQPPFSIDVDNFKFTPRVQRLHELEAKTRIKLNFIDQIGKFWELQGSPLRIPAVERRALDLYSLHKLVQSEGGFDVVCKERKWSKVASKMHFPPNKTLGSVLKSQYEKMLYPYDVFQKKKEEAIVKDEEDVKVPVQEEGERDKEDKEYKPTKLGKKIENDVKRNSVESAISPKPEVGLSQFGSVSTVNALLHYAKESSDNKELRRLQFYGAGPKMAGYNKRKRESEENLKNKTRGKKVAYDVDPLAKYVCRYCDRGDMEESMLLCDGCDDSYHIFCLTPPLTEIPKGDWRCPKCVAVEVSKPTEAFGFEQAQKEYSLQQFGEMADKFKSDYFNMPGHEVPTSAVEKEFWRIVSSIDEDVTVEYGADLHTMDHGSGFPTNEMFKKGTLAHPMLKKYADSEWNLNNLPVLSDSVLSHIHADISGMKVPWMYVGMCFATFCWHNEDHWSYSINYLHWGEPKTWYGVPGERAEEFEKAMMDAAPELFQSQPDLLHQLVTIMNPNEIMAAGVPVCRTDQMAGEFVITFPRAYHAGFNQGYNFAEAVNFAPADWLKIGRDCVAHYSNLRRFCVFSHDELVCKMANNPESLEPKIAIATYQDMLGMVRVERRLRKILLEWGCYTASRVNFEEVQDDERQCEVCKTMCYNAAISCPCTKLIVCIRHYNKLCSCPPEKHVLKYKHTLDELYGILKNLKIKSDDFETWVERVMDALNSNSTKPKMDFEEFNDLAVEAIEKRFQESELLTLLMNRVDIARKCSDIAQHLITNSLKQDGSKPAPKLTVDEVAKFCQQIEKLPCRINEEEVLRHLANSIMGFQKEAKEVLLKEVVDSNTVDKLINVGSSLHVILDELPMLKEKYVKMRCIEGMELLKNNPDQVTSDCLRMILKTREAQSLDGMSITYPGIKELLKKIEDWEERTNNCLTRKLLSPLIYAENLLKEAENIKALLPGKAELANAIAKAKEWTDKVDKVVNGSRYPFISELITLVEEGEDIPLSLDELTDLKARIRAVQYWKEKATRIFVRRNSFLTLLESITPRTECGVVAYKERKKSVRNGTHKPRTTVGGVEITSTLSNEEITEAFHAAENKEKEMMCNLRLGNLKKKNHGSPDAEFCLCRMPASGQMVECTLCREWFHKVCVPTARSGPKKQPTQSDTIINFMCPVCLRTKRPKPELIVQLLLHLHKIPARFPESEALRLLTDRANSYTTKAQQLLKSDEMRKAQYAIGLHRLSQNNSLQDTKVPESLGSVSVLRGEHGEVKRGPCSPPKLNPGQITVKKVIKNLSNKEQVRPAVILTKATRIDLKQLLMEGDLMEMNMRETQRLWRVAQGTKPYSAPTNTVKDANDEEEYCAAMNCLHPCATNENTTVDWVQCDGGCEKWFHMVCVGLHKTDIRDDEDYICQNCIPVQERMSESPDLIEIGEQVHARQEFDDNFSLSNSDFAEVFSVDDDIQMKEDERICSDTTQ